MGSEGEIASCDSHIYVAVGRNVKVGKSLLTWAAENFGGSKICLVHVHQPGSFVSLCKLIFDRFCSCLFIYLLQFFMC